MLAALVLSRSADEDPRHRAQAPPQLAIRALVVNTPHALKENPMIIDAWAQHPTLRHSQDPMFESLRRWTKVPAPTEPLPVSATVAAMDAAGVAKSLICAWVAPRNVMISNDEVAGFIQQAPERLVGVGSVDIAKPMNAVREVRRCVQECGSIPCTRPAAR